MAIGIFPVAPDFAAAIDDLAEINSAYRKYAVMVLPVQRLRVLTIRESGRRSLDLASRAGRVMGIADGQSNALSATGSDFGNMLEQTGIDVAAVRERDAAAVALSH
jgi:hypothetical protein